jgi:hypothetical protein
MARACRERTLEQHTSDRRAGDLLEILERASSSEPGATVGCADDDERPEG